MGALTQIVHKMHERQNNNVIVANKWPISAVFVAETLLHARHTLNIIVNIIAKLRMFDLQQWC